MKFEEKTLSSKVVYDGKVMKVIRDEIETADGHKSFREVVIHSGGVVILAMKSPQEVLVVEQYRYPLKRTNIELPAGKLEVGEDPLEAAKRELVEETGYIAKTWKSLGFIHTTPGICTETLYLYHASDLEYIGDRPDEGEILKCSILELKDFVNYIKLGKISDSKTICAFMRATIEEQTQNPELS